MSIQVFSFDNHPPLNVQDVIARIPQDSPPKQVEEWNS